MRILTKYDREVDARATEIGSYLMVRRQSTGAYLEVILSHVETRHLVDALTAGRYSKAMDLLDEAQEGIEADEEARQETWQKENLQLDLGKRIEEFVHGAD